MARYNYDIDSRTKLLDTHKQFSGGLKTVDTDDSVKTFYLRNMSNLSLSEFGFLEKRYGQYIEKTLSENATGILQHYSSYADVDIFVIDGKLYSSPEQGKEPELVNQINIGTDQWDSRFPSKETLDALGFNPIGAFEKYTDKMQIKHSVYSEPYRYQEVHRLDSIYETYYVYLDIDVEFVFNQYDEKVYERKFSADNPYVEGGTAITYNYDAGIRIEIESEVEPNGIPRYAYEATDKVWNTPDFVYSSEFPFIYQNVWIAPSKYYKVENEVTPKGEFTLVEVDIDDYSDYLYGDLTFQDTRTMDAVRIDDRIYLMTGDYPIYWEDYKWYLMPIYEPIYAEINQFSHNLLENDFEDLYRYTYSHPSMTHDTVKEEYGEEYDIGYVPKLDKKDGFSVYPKLPYNNEDNPRDKLSGLNIKTSFDVLENSTDYDLNQTFDSFIALTAGEVTDESLIVEPYIYIFSENSSSNSWNDMDNVIRLNDDLTYRDVGDWWHDKHDDKKSAYKYLNLLFNKDTIVPLYKQLVNRPIDEVITTNFASGQFNKPYGYDGNEIFVDFWAKAFGKSLQEDDEFPFEVGKIYKIGVLKKESDDKFHIYYHWAKWYGDGLRNSLDQYWKVRTDWFIYGRNMAYFVDGNDGKWAWSNLSPNVDTNGIRNKQYIIDAGWATLNLKSPFSDQEAVLTTTENYLVSNNEYTERPPENFILFEVFPAVFTRPAGGTESEWLEIPDEYYEKRPIYNNANADASIKSLMSDNDLETEETPVFPLEDVTGNLDAITPMEFRVTKLPYGSIDIKVATVFRRSGYYDDLIVDEIGSEDGGVIGKKATHRWKQESFIIDDYVMREVVVTNEIVEDWTDFNTSSVGYPAVWSCNRVVNHYGKLLAFGSKEQPDRVFVSHPSYHNYFPYFFTMDFKTDTRQPITAITPFMNALVVQAPTYTWGLGGVDAVTGLDTTYNQFTINPVYGTVAPGTVRQVRNKLFFLSAQGVVALKSLYSTDQMFNVEIMDLNIKNIVPFDDAQATAIEWDGQYIINFPNSEDNLTLRYYIDKGAWVKDNYFYKKLDTEWSEYDFNGVFKYVPISGRYLAYITHPMTRDSENPKVHMIMMDKDLPTDLEENIFSYFETAFINQDYPFHPKQYKEVKFDFSIQNEYNRSNEPVYVDHTIGDFNSEGIIELKKNHWYQIDFGMDIGNFDVTVDGGLLEYTTYEDTLDGGDAWAVYTDVYDGFISGIFYEYFDGGDNWEEPTEVFDANYFWYNWITPEIIALGNVFNEEDGTLDTDARFVLDSYSLPQYYFSTILDGNFNLLDVIKDVESLLFIYENGKINPTTDGENYIFKSITGAADYDIAYTRYADQEYTQDDDLDVEISLYDVTYDDKVTFKTWVMTEDNLINLEDNIESYDAELASYEQNLGTDFGKQFVFGDSDFGNRTLTTKTVRLAGKGKNIKVYFEEEGKSKWTLETLGIMFKLKRARGTR